jgi:multiple sugar transport system substrate-binding protein
MHRYFRWAAGMVALLLIGTMLAACGGAAATPTAAPAAQATTAPAPAATTAPAATSAPAATTAPAATAPAEATAAPAASGGGNLQIIWFAWQPCQALTDLVKNYKDAAVEVRCVPIAQWHDQIFTDFAAKGGADVVILDSQFIGEAVKGGHVLDLTDWMKAGNIEVDDYVPAALSAYGEYPAGSGKYYGVAAEGDTQMLVYRKDIFNDQKVKDAFKAKASKDLAVPTKWTDLLEIAKFFKENPDVGGVPNGYTTFWCGTKDCYDQVATVWNQMAWSFGGELWDPKTYKVQGVINSDTNVKALQFAADLFKTGPEGSGNFTFNETVSAICGGQVVMTTIWFGFGPAFLDKNGCKQSDNLAYDLVPGQDKHVTSLGGMGLSVSSYTKDKDAALALVKWFESKDTQLAWAKLGGFSARKSVLASDDFQKAAPYNPIFAKAYQDVKDFWNVPEYNQLLQTQMEHLNLAITGQEDPKQALDTIAEDQQKIFDDAYPNGPPK